MDDLTLLHHVRTRRSIRRYTNQLVDLTLIEAALEAATHAPSAHNRQPWRFAVVTLPDAKERLASAMGERLCADRLADGDSPAVVEADVVRSRARITSAPVLVLACLSMTNMDRYANTRRSDALGLPADWEPQALITLGYPAELPRAKMVQPLTSKVVYR